MKNKQSVSMNRFSRFGGNKKILHVPLGKPREWDWLCRNDSKGNKHKLGAIITVY